MAAADEAVFIGLASNIRPEENITAALDALSGEVRLTGLSSFYRSPAIDRPDQDDYLNGVAMAVTEISPHSLKFDILRKIESSLGRVRVPDAYAARTLDLDILVYGLRVIEEANLRIPDPDILERAFLSAALLELAPEMVFPGTGRPLAEMVEQHVIGALAVEKAFTTYLHERFLNEPGKNC